MQPIHERPRLLRDIVVVSLDTGVLVDGLGRQETIRGPFAQTVLPELLDLLDGTRTLPELEDAFPSIPPGYVRTAVATLKEWGMLEAAAEQSDSSPAGPDTMSFLRRQIAAAGLASSAQESARRLREAKILVVAGETGRNEAKILQDLLLKTGAGSVDLIAKAQLRAAAAAGPSHIVALGEGSDDLKWHSDLDGLRSNLSFSWLRAVIHQDLKHADIGPLFGPGSDSCYECFQKMHVESAKTLSLSLTPLEERMWASLIALEMIRATALPNLGISGRQFRRFHTPQWDSRFLSYSHLPGCPHCQRARLCAASRGHGRAVESMTDTALVFEDHVGVESRATLSAGAKNSFVQAHQLPAQQGRFPNCEQIPLLRGTLQLDLDSFAAMRPKKKNKSSALTLDKLAGILALTGGIREISETALRRWAATAGNLGSVELFVVNRAIAGLPPGYYHYEAAKHALAALRKREGLEVPAFMGRVLDRAERDLPDALLLLTGAFHVLSKKYGSFAYRLVNLDAGSVLSQLHVAARGMGLCARTVPSMADDLIQEQLNIGEQPTAIVEMFRLWHKRSRSRKSKKQNLAVAPFPRSWKAARQFGGLDASEVTTMLLDESRVLEAESRHHKREIPPHLLSRDHPRRAFKLPKPARDGLSLGEILGRRRSVRQYSQRPVEAAAIGDALHCASSMDQTEWPDEYRHPSPLSYLVLAKRVSGIPEGVYCYDASRHGLCQVRPPLSQAETLELFVQSEFAEAPALIWITGNLAAACASAGAKGHRHLLLRAGAAGHRLWMAALALGLSGCLLAGLIPGAARRLLGIDGYTTASLFAFAFGHPVGEQQGVPGASQA